MRQVIERSGYAAMLQNSADEQKNRDCPALQRQALQLAKRMHVKTVILSQEGTRPAAELVSAISGYRALGIA